mgnify:CR=1 FL=1
MSASLQWCVFTHEVCLSMLNWLWLFVKPYRIRLAIALLALMVTAGLTLSVGQGIRLMIDQGFSAQSHQGLADAFIMLSGQYNCIDCYWLIIFIDKRNLAFSVWS